MPALDGVRAFAVVAVVLYHGGVSWLPGGYLGVDVFFALSGYLITSLLLAERRGTGRIDLKAFWLRRARRLLPAALVVIAVSVVVVAVFSSDILGRVRGDALASLLYVNNWHQILADGSYFTTLGRPSPLMHLWSLSVEEQFYLLWPLVLMVLLPRLGTRRTGLLTLGAALVSALLMAVIYSPGEDPTRVYFGTDTHASGLLLGAAVAFAWPMGRFRPVPARAALALDAIASAAFLGLVLAMLTMADFETLTYRGGIPLVGLLSAVLVAVVAHPSCRVARVLAVQPLRWIGERSYGIYLWHWPVMVFTRPEVDLPWPSTLVLVLQVGLTVGLAAASYKWVEQPVRTGAARAWLDHFAPRRRLAIVGASLLMMLGVTAAVSAPAGGNPAAESGLTVATSAAAAAPVPKLAATTSTSTTTVPKPPQQVLAVGASVMLSAADALGPGYLVDAAVGRQAPEILARLDAYRVAGQLPRKVVVQLGENGPITGQDLEQLKALLVGIDRVVLLNVRVPRSWELANNLELAALDRGWEQARLGDWHTASGRPELLSADGIHPTPEGRQIYAGVVAEALD